MEPKFSHCGGSTYKQDYRFVIDSTNYNLTSRQDYLRSKSECFTYDTGLDRLLTVTGPQNLTMNYAANGNFSQKSDVGSVYTYGTTGKPYQLTEIETPTGLVSDVEQTVVYTSFEQPATITESPYQTLFTYNASGERAKMEVKQSGTTIKTRWYAGSRYLKETAGGVTKEFTWIGGDAYSAPCLAVTQSGATTYYYLLRDHLGTITHTTDASGNVVNEYSFDAWGRRRNFTDWSYAVAAQTDILPDRGFTDHEYLPWFKLYNMNGRLYDPVVGRFLEPDPIIQNAFSTQNLNRYSYALNNPLKYVDPSGNRLIPSPEEERWINPYYFGPGEWGPVGPGHGNYWSDSYNNRNSGGSSGGSDYRNFWDQLITSTNHLSDGEYKLMGFGLNENNQFAFLFFSQSYINRIEDFNNRMALASASNIGYGASFIGEGDPIGGNPSLNNGEIRQYDPNLMDSWSESENFLGKITYQLVDGISVTLQSFILGPNSTHLNGSFVVGDERTDAFVNTASWALITTGYLKVANSNNWLRIGWGKDKGEEVFRVAWGAGKNHVKDISNPVLRDFNIWLRQQGKGHWDIWRP